MCRAYRVQRTAAIHQERAMSRAKKKLSLSRETLRVLNAVEIRAVAGAGTNAGFTNSPGCEKSGVVGHCEQPSRMPDNCGHNGGRQNPDVTMMLHCTGRDRLPQQSLSFCLDKPPWSGRTLPPTAMD
jgi:hypothetical protein